jgi:hypothetical protein
MKTILQRTTTITVFGTNTVVQPLAGQADMKDCNVVTVYAQVYGMTGSGTAARIGLKIENSATGDYWVDALGSSTIGYGPNQFVLKYDGTSPPPLVGPLFRWKVTGTGPNLVSSISFRILLVGEKVD